MRLKRVNFDERSTSVRTVGQDSRRTHPKGWRRSKHELQQILRELDEIPIAISGRSLLSQQCHGAADCARRQLQKSFAPHLASSVTARALHTAEQELQRELKYMTHPCFTVATAARSLARMGLHQSLILEKDTASHSGTENLGHRLSEVFRAFPALSDLWGILIGQWKRHVQEIVTRFVVDRQVLADVFFHGESLAEITDLRVGLSDRHNDGRTVALLKFGKRALIYKPRSGDGEMEWQRLVRQLNARGFRPKLRAANLVRRTSYCWMEYIKFEACTRANELERLQERIGAIIAMACVVEAVDLHRHNFVAAGEHPILIDAETLWHGRGISRSEPAAMLTRTGLVTGSMGSSKLQRSCSVVATAGSGKLGIHIGNQQIIISDGDKLIQGFRNAYRLMHADIARTRLSRPLCRVRHLYRSTSAYERTRRASIQPSVLRSVEVRSALIHAHSDDKAMPTAVVAAERRALYRFDIPYLVRSARPRVLRSRSTNYPTLARALRKLLIEA